jgi:2C-methyl-D-erythritol 2,4-cyclodiphosphate synthase
VTCPTPHDPTSQRDASTPIALQLDSARVGIKATTNETMGFVGRKEGIAAMAVAMVVPL